MRQTAEAQFFLSALTQTPHVKVSANSIARNRKLSISCVISSLSAGKIAHRETGEEKLKTKRAHIFSANLWKWSGGVKDALRCTTSVSLIICGGGGGRRNKKTRARESKSGSKNAPRSGAHMSLPPPPRTCLHHHGCFLCTRAMLLVPP